MDRKDFIEKALFGLGAIVGLPILTNEIVKESNTGGNCEVSPSETAGPFPILTPMQYIRASIIGDRIGIPLLMNISIQDKRNGCRPLEGVFVDVWQCDKDGKYSQYGDHWMQRENLKNENFLRGRQTTNNLGQVLFISIFPGWYPGRAPHIHLEVLKTDGTSILVTQIAFPKDIYTAVYETKEYNGPPDHSNEDDNIFLDSLSSNMADKVTGDITEGYILSKTIVIA